MSAGAAGSASLLPKAWARVSLEAFVAAGAGALDGIAFRVLWVAAPRWLYTPCYLALGWAPVRYLPDFLHTGGAAVLTLVVAGGLLYSAGAVVYALQRPDPSPCWFGFHEVFTAHYIDISLAVY